MEIQWSLVLFTVLTGAAGWLLACVALDEFLGKTKRTNGIAVIVAALVACVGGIASVMHLAHPENMLGALSHPTSGIFTEAVLVGLMAACAVVYFILLKREAPATARKVFAILGGVFGIVLSFMAGASYMMSSQLAWNTPLLPLGYAGSVIPLGVGLYVAIAASQNEDDLTPYPLLLLIGGIVALVTTLAYGAFSGAIADQALLLWGGCILLGGALPTACGALIRKKPESAFTLALVSAAGALCGAVAFRCIMWLAFDAVNNFFGML